MMVRILLALLFFSSIEAQEKLNITRVLQLALKNNQGLRASQYETAILDFDYQSQRTDFHGKWSINSSLDWQETPDVNSTNSAFGGLYAQSTYNYALQWNKLIYSSAKKALLNRYSPLKEAAGFQYDLQHWGLISQLKSLCYELILAKQVVLLQKQFLDQTKDESNLIKRKHKSGQLSKLDVLRSETELATAKFRLIDSQGALKEIQKELDFLVNSSEPIRWEVFNDVFIKEMSNPDWDQMKLLATSGNFDYQLLQSRKKALEWELKAAKEANSPEADIFASKDYSRGQRFPIGEQIDVGSVGVRLKWAFGDGGLKKTKINKLNAQIVQLSIRMEEARSKLTRELHKIRIQLDKSIGQIRVMRSSIKQASLALKITQTGYESGSNIYLQVQDAKLALNQAQINLARAKSLYSKSCVQLQVLLKKNVEGSCI